MRDKPAKAEEGEKQSGFYKNSATLAGFLLFLTGGTLVLIAMLDILVRVDGLRTALYLVIGVVMYKFGHAILNHFASFRTQKERRRSIER